MPLSVTPWNLQPDPRHVHLPLTPAQEQALAAVLAWRGVFQEDLLAMITPTDLTLLLAAELLHCYPSDWGPVLVPGPAGLLRDGKTARNRPSPVTAADHAYVTHAISLLNERGWEYGGLRRRNLHILVDPDGVRHYVCGRARGHASRSLWRLIATYRVELSQGRGRLVIVTPDRRHTARVQTANPWCIEVLHLKITPPPEPPPAPRLPEPYTGRRRRVRPTTAP